MTDVLYCLPGDEVLHTSIERCLHEHGPGRYTIEVWDTHPPEHHMPSEDRLLEFIDDWACDLGEVDEHWCEQLHKVITTDEVAPLIVGILYKHLGSKITYRMAKDRIDTREIIATLDPNAPDASLIIWNAALFDTIAPESVRLTSWGPAVDGLGTIIGVEPAGEDPRGPLHDCEWCQCPPGATDRGPTVHGCPWCQCPPECDSP